ncbi:unnamed protein product, partial [Aphis gossypii]
MLIRTAPIPGAYPPPPPLIVVHRTGFAAAHNLHLYLSPLPTDGTGIITLRLFEFNGHYACSLLKCTLCAFRPPLWPAPALDSQPLSQIPPPLPQRSPRQRDDKKIMLLPMTKVPARTLSSSIKTVNVKIIFHNIPLN